MVELNDVDVAIDLLVQERITSTSMVPTVLRQLLESPRLASLPRDALAGIASGGAPVPPDLIRAANGAIALSRAAVSGEPSLTTMT